MLIDHRVNRAPRAVAGFTGIASVTQLGAHRAATGSMLEANHRAVNAF
jgi:hypothetical protein